MIRTLAVKGFSGLPNAEFQFGRGLNVILAENGQGKTLLMKLLYTVEQVLAVAKDRSKTALGQTIGEKLVENFRTEALGRLVRRQRGCRKAEVGITHEESRESTVFTFGAASKKVVLTQRPEKRLPVRPIFLPTRELATFCPWFVSLYDACHVEFEGLWRDTCSLLAGPTKKGVRTPEMQRLLDPLEAALGGTVTVDRASGKLLLKTGDGPREMTLVDEGVRKIVMLVRLADTGALRSGGTLFWDEPEANMDARLLRVVAQCLRALATLGMQVFVATHSVVLVRELYRQDQTADAEEKPRAEIRWFSLRSEKNSVKEGAEWPWQMQRLFGEASEKNK